MVVSNSAISLLQGPASATCSATEHATASEATKKIAGTLACTIDAPRCIMSLTCFRWSSPYKKQLRDSARVGAGRYSVANNVVQ
jgi:hypothetical protein